MYKYVGVHTRYKSGRSDKYVSCFNQQGTEDSQKTFGAGKEFSVKVVYLKVR